VAPVGLWPRPHGGTTTCRTRRTRPPPSGARSSGLPHGFWR
jgi:hypothetical protein